MTLKLKIILRACCIRMTRGEKLEDILASYQKLISAEVDVIRAEAQKTEK